MINKLSIGNFVTIDNPKYHPKLKEVIMEITGINECNPLQGEDGTNYSISLKHINQEPNTYYETYSQFVKYIKPVLITRDTLLFFGFKEESCGAGEDEKEWLEYTLELPLININLKFDGEYYCNLTDYGLTKLKYIHSLQNLLNLQEN